MYFILNFIFQNLINIYCAATVSFCLVPKYSRHKSIILYSAVGFFIFIVKFQNFDNEFMLTASALMLQLSFFLFTLFFHKDSLFRQLIVFSVVLFGNIVSELVSLFILSSLYEYSLGLEPESREFTMAILLALPVQILFNSVFMFFWNYSNIRKGIYSILIFSLFPMLQMLIGNVTFITLLSKEVSEGYYSVAILCSILAFCSTIVLLFLLLKKEEKKSLEEAYLELKELYQLETANYQTIEARHEELSKLRHDFNNQLSTLYMLISAGKTDAAREFAASLKEHTRS